jgi:transposase
MARGSRVSLDCCYEHAGLCLAEVPPDRRREAMVASPRKGGTRWRSCSTGSPGWIFGKESVTVCLRTPGPKGRRHAETRTFKTMTGSLQVMRDWLVEAGVSIAAMESTSTYWKPPLYCLEEQMTVWLLNAAHMKAVPGRKSDVRDAEWIAQLLEHGLLAPSFVPPPEIRRLRMLTRYRVQLMADRAREIVRLELMLEDASIKLSSVASSLKTVSARAILTAMINGESDSLRLADMAKGRMRRKIPDLAQALSGHFDANHARLARSMLRRLDLGEQAMAELDAVIVEACQPWQHQIELLQTIPGVGPKVAETIVAETGGHDPVPDRRPIWPRGRAWHRR